MALGTNQITTTTAAVFIPEVWSNEVRAEYEKRLVMANLVKKINHNNKAGDTIHIPDVSNISAHDKAANTQVTLNAVTESEIAIVLNKHKESSFVVEDIVKVQASYDLRSLYTKKAGYAIAKAVEDDIIALYSGATHAVIGGDGTTAWDPSANSNAGNGSDLTDVGIRNMIELLDSNDVPDEDRFMVIPPCQKNVLLGIDKFINSRYVEGRPVVNGHFGNIYGVEVYYSNNLPTVTADDGSTKYKIGFLFQREALVYAEQLAPRSQSQYKQEYLGWLVTIDTIYGVKIYRPDNLIVFYVPE